MKKIIEVTPEWVLSNIPQALYADGCGHITLDVYDVKEVKWIELALQTLCINFKENEYTEDDVTIIDIEFRLRRGHNPRGVGDRGRHDRARQVLDRARLL